MSVTMLDDAGVEDATRTAWLAAPLRRVLADQQGRRFLWCAQALAAGIGLYFALPSEPQPLLLATAAALAALLVWLGRSTGPLLLAGIVLFGFALAGFQAGRAATPLLSATTGEVLVTGRAVSVERSSRTRLVMILAPDQIEGVDAARLPRLLHPRLLLLCSPLATASRSAFR